MITRRSNAREVMQGATAHISMLNKSIFILCMVLTGNIRETK